MATATPTPQSPSSSDHIPTAVALPATVTTTSRRLPPPCWSPDETVALIDAYTDKWYSLSRGSLRANHWQDVADDVAARCPSAPKTAVQCRHKMEKLRKRYRAEIQRAAAARASGRRFSSSWAHFQNMHSMEMGGNTNNNNNNNPPSPPPSSSSEDDDDDDHKSSVKRLNDLYNRNVNQTTPGVRIKIPVGLPTTAKAAYNVFDEMPQRNPNPNPRFATPVANGYGAAVPNRAFIRDGFPGRSEIGRGEFSKNKKKKVDNGGGGVGEVVAAIQTLGEGFMRIEKVKMDMARQIEEMRMDMELKRTEMILESQHRVVEAFANAICERGNNKKAKRVPN